MDQLTSFVINNWELFLALVIIIALLFASNLQSALSGVVQVGPAEAIKMINHEKAVVVDVREDKEFVEGHIINSIHIPLGNVQQRVNELKAHREKPIIVSCRSGTRSNAACSMLRKNGFENVFNLKGGIMAWQNASLPLSK
ncbi:MAG: rhodanese-like domain-containing protein [Granulosicoccaceae bacterium]|jgi:rhodanese-related sulfurtransferase